MLNEQEPNHVGARAIRPALALERDYLGRNEGYGRLTDVLRDLGSDALEWSY